MRHFFTLLLILASQKGLSQNFLWGNTMGYKNYEEAYNECLDMQGNAYVIGGFQDSISMGSQWLIRQGYPGFITKFDYNGKVVWFKSVLDYYSEKPLAIVMNSKSNQFYISGTFTKKVFFTPKDSLVNPNRTAYLAKYDTSGKFIWAKVIPNSSNFLLDKHNNFTFFGGVADSIFITKYDSTLKQIWRTSLPCKGNIENFSQDSTGNIYATGEFGGTFSTTKFTITNKSTKYPDIFILKLDSSGNVVWLNKAGGGKSDVGWLIRCFKNGNFYLIGFYGDTAYFENTKVTGSPNGDNLFVAFYHADGRLQWVRKAYKTQGSCHPGGIDLFDNYLYIGGAYQSCTPVFGRHKLPDIGNSNLFFAKMDSLGTFLWSFSQGSKNGGSGCSEFKTDYQGSSICVGGITGNANFGNFSLNSAGLEDAFIIKISDVSLYRDSIKKTGYCPGDSIEVPYHVNGIIGTGNTYTAELSYKDGSFDSIWYEIGKLKTQGNGVIKCKLPMGLPYSTKYNVHVYSDTPNVTSYYNPQTITIYPMPTANAGKDTTVCANQKITLQGKGGIKYLWQPSLGLNDSTSPNPTVKLSKTTTFILSAFNGNGCFSTDMVTITVNPVSSFNIKANVCNGSGYFFAGKTLTKNGTYYDSLTNQYGCDSIVTLELTFGKSSNTTLAVSACNSYVFKGKTLTQTGTYYDSLTTVFGCDSVVTLKLIINDDNDSTISISACDKYVFNKKTLTSSGTYYDTLKNISGCDSIVTLNLTIYKSNGSTISVLSCYNYFFNGNTLTSSGTYYDTLINKNGCDSVITLNLTIQPNGSVYPKDTSICNGDSITLSAMGGTSYLWNTNHTTNQIRVAPNQEAKYVVKISDANCSNTDTATVHVYSICPETLLRIYIPNAFSPQHDEWNKDSLNQYFEPVGEDVVKYSMTIWNRWGNKIFETEKSERWDGTVRSRNKFGMTEGVPLGVYYYNMTITDHEGKEHKMRGSVEVVR